MIVLIMEIKFYYMFHIPPWLIVIVILNIAIFAIVLNPNPIIGIPTISSSTPTKNVSVQKNETATNIVLNQSSNQTLNLSTSQQMCTESIGNYIKGMANITNFTTIETRVFNKSDDAIKYAERNWSSKYYEIDGLRRDAYSIVKKKIVSVNKFITDKKREFTLPIVCDEYGNLGNYSSCIIRNIPDIPSTCHNMTINITDCEIEILEHDFWEDINYTVFPKPGRINITQLFNFTITSSRKRLEYAIMSILYKKPAGEEMLFSQTKRTTTGDKISITTKLNLTGKSGGSVVALTLFKKKCYDVYTIT
jgi:hypothetical protein